MISKELISKERLAMDLPKASQPQRLFTATTATHLRLMSKSYPVHIHYRQEGTHHDVEVPGDRYILQTAEDQGVELPFSCRNGACTTCAVRVISGDLYQPEAMGLSPELRAKGYALLCVSYPCSPLEVETQDEDEVYEQQFGRYFGKGKVRQGLPLDEE